MTQEIREKIEKYLDAEAGQLPALISGDNEKYMELSDFLLSTDVVELRQSMTFDSPADIRFDFIDFYFGGLLYRLLVHAEACTKYYKNWVEAYEKFKPYFAHFVGWTSYVSEETHPALHSQEAYSMVMSILSDVCENASCKRRKKKSEIIREILPGID